MSDSTAAIRHNAPPVAGARDAERSSSATAARRLDPESRAWLEALDSDGLRRDEAIGRLYTLVLREARFEVRRRTASLCPPLRKRPRRSCRSGRR